MTLPIALVSIRIGSIQNELDEIWQDMSGKVSDLYKKFDNKPDKSQLDIVRTKLSDNIYEFSKNMKKGHIS